MRLLECGPDEEFSLTEDLTGEKIPVYAILSHTWGPDNQEVTFEDVVKGIGKDKAGYSKIRFCAEQARRDGLRYFWVDTCCIDKSNNNELSEAINSMFRWYRDAARCYVYLSDISITGREQNGEQSELTWESTFRTSRWFTRGWTLQELLAPASVQFFTREGRRLGDKRSLEQHIYEITGISISALRGKPLSQFGVDERFKWAETRQTAREEDLAYCLLGIFGVFTPLIYGEGRENAIRRLRKEIVEALKPSGVPRNSPPVLHRQPSPTARTVLVDPKITDPLEIEIGTLPSQEFLVFMDRLPSTAHADIADIIFSNCKVTCFNFYRLHGLRRTKFGRKDNPFTRKLFQTSDLPEPDSFPQTANDLSLDEWTSKLVHAHGRINEPDTIQASHLNDYIYSTNVFKHISKIASLVDAWGKVKVDVVEELLVYSLALCQVLKGWDSLDRLKALWDTIHQPESPFINKALLIPPLSTQPPARNDDPAVDKGDHRPFKRARVEEHETTRINQAE